MATKGRKKGHDNNDKSGFLEFCFLLKSGFQVLFPTVTSGDTRPKNWFVDGDVNPQPNKNPSWLVASGPKGQLILIKLPAGVIIVIVCSWIGGMRGKRKALNKLTNYTPAERRSKQSHAVFSLEPQLARGVNRRSHPTGGASWDLYSSISIFCCFKLRVTFWRQMLFLLYVTRWIHAPSQPKECIFEFIYFIDRLNTKTQDWCWWKLWKTLSAISNKNYF